MASLGAERRQVLALASFAVSLIVAAGAVASFATDGMRTLAVGLVAVVAVVGLVAPSRVIGPVVGLFASAVYLGVGLADEAWSSAAVVGGLIMTGVVGGEIGAHLAGGEPGRDEPFDADGNEAQAPRTPVMALAQFRPALALEVARARRYEHTVSLLMVGVEDWPTLVAQRGPIAARRRLADVAEAVRRVVRDVDSVSVYGPGLLAVLLPETPLAGAAVVADKVTRVAREHGGLSIRVGAAAYPDDALTPDELLREAEAALELAGLAKANVVEQARLD